MGDTVETTRVLNIHPYPLVLGPVDFTLHMASQDDGYFLSFHCHYMAS